MASSSPVSGHRTYYVTHLPGASATSVEGAMTELGRTVGTAAVIKVDVSELRKALGGVTAPAHAVLVVPGGSTMAMARALEKFDVAAPVRSGAGYWGICAGAIVGTKDCVYQTPGRPFELPMFELLVGTGARGPVFAAWQDKALDWAERRSATVACRLGAGMTMLELNWCHGPLFVKSELSDLGVAERTTAEAVSSCYQAAYHQPPADVVATYAELPSQPPAIIEGDCGRGHVILSGVHWEVPVDNETHDNKAGRETLITEMVQRLEAGAPRSSVPRPLRPEVPWAPMASDR